MIYLISDTHFNHQKVIEYCGRPLDYEQRLFNSMAGLKKDDTLIHLGDVCIGKDGEVHAKWIEPLKCRKWLVLGNHDRKSKTWYGNHGWDVVTDEMWAGWNGISILFTHRPEFNKIGWDLNIHGHLHNTAHRIDSYAAEHLTEKHKLVAVEYLDYKVISLDAFLGGT